MSSTDTGGGRRDARATAASTAAAKRPASITSATTRRTCSPTIEARARARSRRGVDREELQRPAAAGRRAQRARLRAVGAGGAARRACRSGSSPGSTAPRPLVTTFTLGADDPDAMAARRARLRARRERIKLKLTGEAELDVARVRAVREARPDVWIGVDANQGFDDRRPRRADRRRWSTATCQLLEQPLARGREADLDGFDRRSRSPPTKACWASPMSRRWSAASTSSTSSSTNAAA